MITKELIKKREEETGHCICGPSQLPRIIPCPASVSMSVERPPSPPSQYAVRGTNLHNVTEDALNNGRQVLHTKYKGMYPTGDLSDVEDCLDYFWMVRRMCSEDAKVRFEVTGNMASWGVDNVWGTADVVIVDHEKGVAHIIDWKFGTGVKVFANKNVQLLAYAAIALGFPSYVQKITIHIGQPGLEHFDTYVLTFAKLRDWVFEELAPAIEQVFSPNPPFNPGDKQCRFCPASSDCPARHADANEKASMVFKMALEPEKLTVAQRVTLYDLLVELEHVKKDLYVFLMSEITAGRSVPGKKLVSGRSIRKWEDQKAAFSYLTGIGIAEDKLFEQKPITPAKAEKINRKLKKDEAFQRLIIKPAGKPTLVDETDKRPGLVPELLQKEG